MIPASNILETFAMANDIKTVERQVMANFSRESARAILYHMTEALQCCASDPALAGHHVARMSEIVKLEREAQKQMKVVQ